MAFEYKIKSGSSLTSSQEDRLEKIENLPFPLRDITCLKDLRTTIGVQVMVGNRTTMHQEWGKYLAQYKKLHDVFFGGERFQACHRHQGEIGERRFFAEEQIRQAKEPREDFFPCLGLYTRNYQWWSGKCIPKVVLITDSIRDYACRANIKEDIVFGLVFIQEMMHAYFDSLNSKGFPSILSLEESFSEFAMISFVDKSPAIHDLLQDAKAYVASKIGKRPYEGGYGIELFERSGDDAAKMIRQYRRISNWIEPPYLYWNTYNDSVREYHKDHSKENAAKVFEDIIEILDKEWDEPSDPIQPAIGDKWGYTKKPIKSK